MIPAYILAGGKSSRMGRDKAQVLIGETSLLERVAGVVTQRCAPVTIVSSATLASSRMQLGMPVICDQYSDCGPLGGLHAALSHTTTDRVMIVACDVPLLSVDLIELLLGCSHTSPIVVAAIDGRPQPLCGVYSRGALHIVEKQLQRGEYAMRSLLTTAGALCVEVGDAPALRRALTNVNSEQDLAEMIDEVSSGAG